VGCETLRLPSVVVHEIGDEKQRRVHFIWVFLGNLYDPSVQKVTVAPKKPGISIQILDNSSGRFDERLEYDAILFGGIDEYMILWRNMIV